jgi:hypothetical protein
LIVLPRPKSGKDQQLSQGRITILLAYRYLAHPINAVRRAEQ